MRSQSAAPACKQRPSRKLLLVGGFTVPVIVLGSVLGSAPAFAATAGGKSALQTAFANATSTYSDVTLTRDLGTDAGDDDRLVLHAGDTLQVDLAGHLLAIDRLKLEDGANLTVTDSSSGGTGRLLVGQAQSAPADPGTGGTGIVLGDGAVFTDESAVITSTGSENNPGIGGTGSTVYVKSTVGHAALTATGAAGAAGIGAAHVIVTEDSRVTATGGTGAAGIGGGSGRDGGTLAVQDTAQVAATAGSGSDVSAVGAGSGGTAAGDTTIASGAKLTTHGALRIPSGTTVTNAGELALDGTASGAGSLQNDGTITGTTAGIDAGLSVKGHHYEVTLDPGAGTGGGLPSGAIEYWGPTLGTTLDGYVPTIAHKRWVGWKNADGTVSTVGPVNASTRALPAGSTDGTAVALTLDAVFRDQITSNAPATIRLRNGDLIPPNVWIHGDGTLSYAVDASTLPHGVTFANGNFAGTPDTNGTFDVTVTVTGPYDDAPVPLSFHFVVSDKPVVTSTSTSTANAGTELKPLTVGAPYSDHLTASGDGTISYTLISPTSALPAGVHFANGVFSGTVDAQAVPGTYSIDVKATSDQFGDSAVKTIVLHVGDAPALTSSDTDLGKATVGEAYGPVRGHLAASGTTDLDAVTFSKTGGELPAGLTIASDGTFSGSVDSGATAKTYAFEVTAHSRYGDSAATVLHLVVGKAPVITSGTPAPLTIGTAYTGSAAIQLTDGGTGTATYSAPSGDLPSGLSLSSTGVLSGTLGAPASGPSAHSYTFLVTAANDFGTRTRSYTVVTGQAPAITTSSLPNASVGGLYEKSIAVTGDDLAHATYSLVADPSSTRTGNAVPDGLSIDANGLIHGSIADVGTSDLRVVVHTVFGDAYRNLTLVADQGAGLIMHDLAPVTVGRAYSTTVANGGRNVTYSIDGGTLPADLTLGADGSITGTLATAQSIDFTVKAVNSFGTTRHRYQFEAGTVPAITASTLETGVLTHALNEVQHVTATGVGSTTATWAKTSGELPHGITLNAQTGALSGTFDRAGTSTFGLKATTAFGTSAEQSYTVVVGAAPVVATTALPDAEVGVAYEAPLAVTGDGTITIAVTGLPDGLSYDAAHGKIVGTPTVDGPVTVDVTVSSRFGTPAASHLALAVAAAVPVPVITVPVPVVTTPAPVVTVPAPAPVVTTQAPAPVVTTPAPVKTSPAPVATTPVAPAPVVPAPVLPDAPKASAKLGHAFSMSVAASSTVAVTYSLKGALPKGLAFDAAKGLISGTPTQAGTYAVTVTAKSAAGTDAQAYTVVVPEQQELISTASSRVVPAMGSAFDVTVGGLLKGERWRITTNGKVLAHGTAAKAGSVVASVTLPKTRADKTYEILVRGSRTVTDPAKTASADFSVTAAVAKKSLKVKSGSTGVRVDRLAPREVVHVLIDGKQAASGRADADGRFVFTPKGLKAGKHSVVVTGGSVDRTGKLTLKVKH